MKSDGSTAEYYELPEGATELQDLISFKNMNAQIGEIFRASYRYGQADHSEKLRDAKKIRFYINAEIDRLLKLQAAKEVKEHHPPLPEEVAQYQQDIGDLHYWPRGTTSLAEREQHFREPAQKPDWGTP